MRWLWVIVPILILMLFYWFPESFSLGRLACILLVSCYSFRLPDKGWIVYQREEIFLKIVFCFCCQFCIQFNVWLQPSLLIEFYYSVTLYTIFNTNTWYWPALNFLYVQHSFSYYANHTHTIIWHLSLFIVSGRNSRVLYDSCSSLGITTSSSKMYHLPLFLA